MELLIIDKLIKLVNKQKIYINKENK
jgi:hypothetical protein